MMVIFSYVTLGKKDGAQEIMRVHFTNACNSSQPFIKLLSIQCLVLVLYVRDVLMFFFVKQYIRHYENLLALMTEGTILSPIQLIRRILT